MTLTALQYIKRETSLPGESNVDFMQQWKRLSDEDKEDLKRAAEKEMQDLEA